MDTAAGSCGPGTATAVPAAPAISMCPNFRNGICLPSSCRSRTWQLVTRQEDRQPSGSAPGGCDPAPCQLTCLPETSCVGFVCQPICSCTACDEPGTGQPPRLVSSCQPACAESTGGPERCCEASSGRPGSCQQPVFVSASQQAGCGHSVCCDPRACQPPSSESTSCPGTSCPPTVCTASPCQPAGCQAGSCHTTSGEGQPCKSIYYQPICYIFKTSQSVPCMPVPCQPSTYVFGSCTPSCCVTSPCQPLCCQPASSISFVCLPGANCQAPCSAKSSCKPASCGAVSSGQPACGRPTFCSQTGYKSASGQPACCVTGSGKLFDGGSSCFQPTPPYLRKASTCLPTSCQVGHESSSDVLQVTSGHNGLGPSDSVGLRLVCKGSWRLELEVLSLDGSKDNGSLASSLYTTRAP
ncbi:keratin-associated protein 29-1 [Phyllostomus hastatus]|uniref:keratin-associated protein 29-1 n=1 Tax=Phyllostomus hastatus TaxID=9423 RepID=UPI001E683CC9|nr:keratin-associated protein 29-1 [Phyllostomus hastatus]